jgi:phospholipid/cholesterol/gamma-HCH transport system ATP-binding protein
MTPPAAKPAECPIVLEMRGVRKSFGGAPVHNGVDFFVREGEIMTLVGGSGQGKTVLLKEIIGLMRPDAGEIHVLGRDVTRMDEEQLQEVRLNVSIVFQGSALFDSLSVGENVAYGLRERRRGLPEAEVDRIVAEKLALVDLPGIEEQAPASLSGGMKKRVAIARALALEPRILLYDEPTTGLDPANVRRINTLIVRMRDRVGVTSVVVTHDMQSAKTISDRLALLDHGRILCTGTWAEMDSSSHPRVRSFLEGELEE